MRTMTTGCRAFITAAAAAAGVLLAFAGSESANAQGTPIGGTPGGAAIQNPVPPTEASVAAGHGIYLAMCAACHGEKADGHGRAVGDYGKRPANLTLPNYRYGTADGDVFDVIQNGVEPSLAMPAWGDAVGETDIWHLVNYLRSVRKDE